MDYSTPETADTHVERQQQSLNKGLTVLWYKYADYLLCLFLLLLASGLNLYRLGEVSIWFDEMLSVERASQSFSTVLAIISASQPNMALYYLLLHGWLSLTQLFGWLPTEFIVRFPSAIFAVLSTLVVYMLGKRFLGRTVGLTVGLLYVLNALQLTYAHEARSYSLQLFLICLGWYALLMLWSTSEPHKRWWICYVVCMTLAIYAHLFSLFILLAQVTAWGCLFLLPNTWRAQVRKRTLVGIGCVIAIGAIVLPLLLSTGGKGKTAWIEPPQLGAIVRFFVSVAGGSKIYVAVLCAACLCNIAFVALGLWKQKHVQADERKDVLRQRIPIQGEDVKLVFPITLVLVIWCAVPFLLSYILSAVDLIQLFSTRYMVVIVPALLLLIGSGLRLLSWRRIQLGIAAVLVLFASFSVPLYYQSAQVEDWREAAFWIQERYQPSHGMLCFNNAQGCQLGLEYYFRAYPGDAAFPSDSPGSFPWVEYDLSNEIEVKTEKAVDIGHVEQYTKKHDYVFFVVARLSGDKEVAQAKNAQQWLDSHCTLTSELVTNTVKIRFYKVV